MEVARPFVATTLLAVLLMTTACDKGSDGTATSPSPAMATTSVTSTATIGPTTIATATSPPVSPTPTRTPNPGPTVNPVVRPVRVNVYPPISVAIPEATDQDIPQVVVMNADTGRQVVAGRDQQGGKAWWRPGTDTAIAALDDSSLGNSIWQMPFDAGAEPVAVTDNNPMVFGAWWSDDSRYVAFPVNVLGHARCE